MNGIERFEVLEGEVTGAVAGRSRALTAGDVLEVPVGSSHVHPHTGKAATATIEHTIEPRPLFVEVYFATWLARLREGRVDRQDEPTFLQVMAILRAGGGGSWVVGPPVWLQKGMALSLIHI